MTKPAWWSKAGKAHGIAHPDVPRRNRKNGVHAKLDKSKAENPYGHGIDTVHRVVDTITNMTRRNQLTERQARAAQRYRLSFDTITASMRGTLGKDGVGGGSIGKTPSRPELEAAHDLNAAADLLGVFLRVVVEEIVGIGRTIGEAADELVAHGRKATARDRDFIARSLGQALDILADKWWPQSTRNPMRSFRSDGAKPVDMQADNLERGRVVHATARRMFEKDEDGDTVESAYGR